METILVTIIILKRHKQMCHHLKKMQFKTTTILKDLNANLR